MIIQQSLLLLLVAISCLLVYQQRTDSRRLTAVFLGSLWQWYCLLLFAQQPLTLLWLMVLTHSSLVLLLSKTVKPWLWTLFIIVLDYLLLALGFELNIHLLLLAIIVYSSMVLALLTLTDQWVELRSLMQTILWSLSLIYYLPELIFSVTVDDWTVFCNRLWYDNLLLMLPLVFPIALISSALYQFAIVGQGTAFPYDPPKRLVTTGIYAYLSNPMQVGICCFMCYWGVVLNSIYVSCTGLVAVLLFIVFQDVCNGSCAIGKNNPAWQAYQQQVPRWIPNFYK